jgi:hypothetical protein
VRNENSFVFQPFDRLFLFFLFFIVFLFFVAFLVFNVPNGDLPIRTGDAFYACQCSVILGVYVRQGVAEDYNFSYISQFTEELSMFICDVTRVLKGLFEVIADYFFCL